MKPITPPDGAPNVLLVLIDDVGFGASSPFGGPINTPVAQRLADGGLRYTRFHTTAICSATRQALLTGRNHHSVGMGTITELATPAPGYTSVRPETAATLPEVLRLNGYKTAQFGKCHEVPSWETSTVGPFDRWPTGAGFEHFYGFVAAETNQYFPQLFEGTTPVEPDKLPEDGYHLTEDLADRAIAWTRQQKAIHPDVPFFMYWAPGATHAPHQAPPEWIEKYKGKFDEGWDVERERIFARQKELGVIPADAELTARDPLMPSWDSMPDEQKPILARQMEVYAGFLEHTDYHLGRLIDVLEEMDELDNTLIYYIIGDNGASAEGTLTGTFNEMAVFNGFESIMTPEFLKERIDDFGGEWAYNHYAVGWAHAMCTPYQWVKQVASHWGGVRNGTIVHWPNGIEAKGEIRNQFSHVIDVAPTVLEAAGIPEPTRVHGHVQQPIEGTAMNYAFDDADADERHTTQYFEIWGNRGIYVDGWVACARNSLPWDVFATITPFEDDTWELYDTNTDWTEARNLAAEQPEKLKHLQDLFWVEAAKYNVLPLDNRRVERAIAELAGRPTLVSGDTQIFYPGMGRLNAENQTINMKNCDNAVAARVEIPKGGANGVLISQGGRFGGWSFYLRDGKLEYCYNLSGLSTSYVESDVVVPEGEHVLGCTFKIDAPGLGPGGLLTLLIDGEEVGSGRIEQTCGIAFGFDSSTDVGIDRAAPVTDRYPARGNGFDGTLHWVSFKSGTPDINEAIPPIERAKFAASRH